MCRAGKATQSGNSHSAGGQIGTEDACLQTACIVPNRVLCILTRLAAECWKMSLLKQDPHSFPVDNLVKDPLGLMWFMLRSGDKISCTEAMSGFPFY